MYGFKKTAAWMLAAVLSILFGCARPVLDAPRTPTPPAEEQDGTYKIVYFSKNSSEFWLRHIDAGIKERCKELGIEYVTFNCEDRDDLLLKVLNNLDDLDADAAIISPTSEGLGPIIASTFEKAGMPVLCLDSRLKTTEGTNVPGIGKQAYQCGRRGGTELAMLANRTGFLEGDEPTEIIMLTLSNFYYENQIIAGFQDALRQALPDLTIYDDKEIETAGMSYALQYSSISEQMQDVSLNKRYIGFAYNDEGSSALYHFLKEKGVDMKKTLICGMGGYEPSYEIFRDYGEDAGGYIAVGIDPYETATDAVDALYERLIKGKALKDLNIGIKGVITTENYQEYFSDVYGERLNAGLPYREET